MDVPSARPGSAPIAAAASAAFVSALAVALSAPSLTDPVLPGLGFVLVLPAIMALLVAVLIRLLPPLRERKVVAIATSLAVSLPWLLVAGAPLARQPWVMWLGLVLAVVLPLWMLRSRVAPILALVAGAVLVVLPESKLELGGGELRPLVVIGMDSSNWSFIQEMIEENPDDLPALQELMRRGAHADLISEGPTASARIWTILATGVSDEENGVRNFGDRRSDVKAGRVWDAVVEPNDGSPAGTAGVVAWLINTPPDDREAMKFNTPGWVTGIREAKPAAANPAKVLESMGEDASNRPGYGELLCAMRSAMAVANADHAWTHLNTVSELVFGKLFSGFSKEDLTWRMKIMRDRINADVYFELAKRYAPDFSALVLYSPDQVGHFFWKYHEVKHGNPELFPSVRPVEARRMGEALRNSYRACDVVLARVMEQVDAGKVTLMLMSDHGMQPLEEARDDKLLKLNGAALLVAAGGGRGYGESMLDKFSASNVDKALYIAAKDPGIDGRRALDDLRTTLEQARNVSINQPLFTLSFAENTAVDGRAANLRVDFLQENKDTLEWGHDLQIGEVVDKADKLFVLETRSGRHKMEGFTLIMGPGIPEGQQLEPISIYDMAPTMLYSMGKKIPEDLPGQVWTAAFSDAHLAQHPVTFVSGGMPKPPAVRLETDAEKKAEGANLEKLGYTESGKKEEASAGGPKADNSGC